jgi:hypothetical protein
MNSKTLSNEPYHISKEIYASWCVDCEAALKRLESIPISLHCWQGDDVGGFEHEGGTLSGGGIQATGNYPGKARLWKSCVRIWIELCLSFRASIALTSTLSTRTSAKRRRWLATSFPPRIFEAGSTGAKTGGWA